MKMGDIEQAQKHVLMVLDMPAYVGLRILDKNGCER